MKKKHKIIILVLVILFISGIAAGTTAFHLRDKAMTNAAIDFLCEKYGAEEDEFKLLDYERGQYYNNDDLLFDIRWSDYKWEFEYKGRSFFVNRIDGLFYDDYQFEDVEKWCVEWLQKNVDERITGFGINSIHLFNFEMNEESISYKKNNYIFSYDKIEEFLNSKAVYAFKTNEVFKLDKIFNSNENMYITISFFYPFANQEKIDKATKDIKTKMEDKLSNSIISYVYHSEFIYQITNSKGNRWIKID